MKVKFMLTKNKVRQSNKTWKKKYLYLNVSSLVHVKQITNSSFVLEDSGNCTYIMYIKVN